ncbi:MAG: threonylcarbamoyl-AMP synthase [Candidatus Staskawiczbacteria bacterium]|nr:threonylcarbamoyl-AMP synthase [Candidatus Staskawiczbacteria bacterium]
MEVIKQKKALEKGLEIIKKGGVIICPTDTVYGLLCDIYSKKAVGKIFKIKRRPKTKPLAVFVKDFKMAKKLAEISEQQERILKKHWPGKFTFILSCELGAHKKLYGVGKKTIGIRIPKYKFLNDLLKKINKPLAQTSANISGKPELKDVREIIAVFSKQKNKPDLVIDGGDLKKSKPSKVIDLTGRKEKILR